MTSVVMDCKSMGFFNVTVGRKSRNASRPGIRNMIQEDGLYELVLSIWIKRDLHKNLKESDTVSKKCIQKQM